MSVMEYIRPRLAVTDRLGTMARVVVATGGRTGDNYSMIAFSSWDYGSLGETETKLKQKNILYRLQVRRVDAILPAAGRSGRSLLSNCFCLPVRWIWRRSD